MKTERQYKAIAKEINSLIPNGYEPARAEAIADEGGIFVRPVYDGGFHHLEFCVDFARVKGLSIYGTIADGKPCVRIF